MSDDTSLRTQVYDSLREALTTGRFAPGQKLTFRFIAGALGVSLTPVREALRRLVAEGAFEMQPNRSVRVPLMTRATDPRTARHPDGARGTGGGQGGAGRRPASRSPSCAASRSTIAAARSRGDSVADRQNIREFHFTLYGIADQPTLLRVIEGLWLQTGPYMNLLYPDFISRPRGPADAGCASSAPCRPTMRLRHAGKSRTISIEPCPMSPISPTMPATSRRPSRRRPSDGGAARRSASPAGNSDYA